MQDIIKTTLKFIQRIPIKIVAVGSVALLFFGTTGYLIFNSGTVNKKVSSVHTTNTAIKHTVTIPPTLSIIPTQNSIFSQNVPEPTHSPLVDCVGVDGKHMQVTQTACDDFNNAWKSNSSGKNAQSNNISATSGSSSSPSNTSSNGTSLNEQTQPASQQQVSTPTPSTSSVSSTPVPTSSSQVVCIGDQNCNAPCSPGDKRNNCNL